MNHSLIDQISSSHSVVTALGLINTARRNGVLHASSDKWSGTIHIANGFISWADGSDGTSGQAALLSLLSNHSALRLYFDDTQNPVGDLQLRLTEFIEYSAAKLRQDQLFQQIAEQDNKRDFLTANPQLLQCNESTLSPQQRALLIQMRELRDAESFAVSNPQLAPQRDLTLDIEKAKILGATKMDYGPFDTAPQPTASDESALSPQQRAQLELNSLLRDEESFLSERGIAKGQDEPALDESARWMLEETAAQLTPEQQRAQFEADSEELRNLEEKFKDFVPPPLPGPPRAVPTKDPIKTAKTLDGDYKPLVDDHERPRAARLLADNETIIDRDPTVVGEVGTYQKEKRFRIDWAHATGPTVLVGMCVALVTLPAYVRSTYRADASLSEKQTHAMIESELKDEVPYAVDTTSQKPFKLTGGSTGPFTASATSAPTKEDERLATARGLASSAQGDKAAAMLEDTITSNPQNVEARLELIKLYLSLGKKAKARQHAIAGLHMRATVDQRNEFARLFEEAQK